MSGRMVRGFDPPSTAFGPGHLGVDFAAAPGTAVRAAGDGVVVFAGRVGTGLHVVTLHQGGIRTTDSFLSTIAVVVGQTVSRGAVLGTSGGTGPGHAADVLHFGVRVGDTYVDPMLLFAPPDLAAVVHLARPRDGVGSAGADTPGAPDAERTAIDEELRVDARPAAGPPRWWHELAAAPRPHATGAAPPVAMPVARPGPRSAEPTAAILGVRPPGASVVGGTVVGGTVVGGSIVGGAVVGIARRRRRRRHRRDGAA